MFNVIALITMLIAAGILGGHLSAIAAAQRPRSLTPIPVPTSPLPNSSTET